MVFINSNIHLTNGGCQFQPANPVELLVTLVTPSFLRCGAQCNLNIHCRTFDYNSSSGVCRLFEGASNTGNMTLAMSTSHVGALRLSPSLFNAFGQACLQCIESRFLTCSNNTCQCPRNSFWNGVLCENQRYSGATCNNSQMCRYDTLGLICSASKICTTPQNMSYTNIFWPFDNNTRDFYNVYNGVVINNGSYLLPGITGYGSSLYLRSNANQYVNIPSPGLDLINCSFTFEVWFYAKSLNAMGINGLIGQCTAAVTNQCLQMALRGGIPFFGFFTNDCLGKTVLNISTWYHLAFIYSYELQQQLVYLNGIIESQNTSIHGYQGSSSTPLTIGLVIPPLNWYFDGQIDHIMFTNRAKSYSEVLDDATLVVHYSFDSDLLDSSSMRINGTGTNILFVNQAIELSQNPSYVQASGLTLLGASNRAYSIALWIYPYSTNGGALVYLWPGATSSVNWCLPLLDLSTLGIVIAQQYDGINVITINGPSLPNGTWTHLVQTYSFNTGISLYINGTLVNSSNPFSYSPMLTPASIILGQKGPGISPPDCGLQPKSINMSQYYGLIDEFYLYSHQLNMSEVKQLAIR
ncbi:unnamed protein product [Adineta steineri]|uniref:Apple domain-containing protein n=1 Tax=Adineta steineri TaxID=433720 RepID=A0A813W4W2_9BILA|nr:unnamed protein product [Adineta steineri]CAF1199056.1 unnamed protein product [Adineta steineri]